MMVVAIILADEDPKKHRVGGNLHGMYPFLLAPVSSKVTCRAG